MYEFLRGPMMWVSSIICVAGLIYQIIQLRRITSKKEAAYYTVIKKKKDKSFKEKIERIFSEYSEGLKSIPSTLRRTILKTQPAMAVLSFIFHLCLLVTPLFLVGHNVLLFQSWNFDIITMPEAVSDILTVVVIVCGLVFFIRRIFMARVRAVSGLWDYILLFITIAPFVSGFLAYHQLVDYNNVIIAHLITGELMLIAMGVTKLSHMIFFFFARFFIGSEYSFRAGSRTWY